MSFQDALVKVIFKGVDMMTGPMKGIENQTRVLEQKMANLHRVGNGMAGFGGRTALMGGGILAGMGGILKSYQTLENVQVDLENAFNGKNGPSVYFADLRRQIEKAGQIMPGTEEDFAKLAVAAKMAGMSTETLAKGGFQAATALKVLFDLSPEDGGRQFVAMAKALGIAGEDSMAFADQIQRLRYGTGITLQEMSDSIPYASAQLKALGAQGIAASGTVLTLAGVLKQTGVEGSQMGTSMGQSLQKLAELSVRFENVTDSRGAVMKAAMKSLRDSGIKLEFFDKNGKFLGIDNMVKQMPKLAKLTQQQQLLVEKLFGTQGAKMVASLVDDKNMAKVAAIMADQEDLSTRVQRKLDTLGAAWEALGGTTVSAIRKIGAAMKPTLLPLVTRLNEIVAKMADWISANPKLTGQIALGVTALGGFLLAGGGTVLVLGKLATGVAALAPLMAAMVPLWPVVAGLAVAAAFLAGGLYLVWKHSEAITPELTSLNSETQELLRSLQALGGEFLNIDTGLGAMGERFTVGEMAARLLVDQIRNMVVGLNVMVGTLREVAAAVDFAFSPLRAGMAAFGAMQDARARGASWTEAIKSGNGAYGESVRGSVGRVEANSNAARMGVVDAMYNRVNNGPKAAEEGRWKVADSMRSHGVTIGQVNVTVQNGMTEDQVRQAGGEAAVRGWKQARSEAQRTNLRSGPDNRPMLMAGAH